MMLMMMMKTEKKRFPVEMIHLLQKHTYLDRGFDLSEPDASFPLLLHDGINDDVVFSFPNDGLDTRFLPVCYNIQKKREIEQNDMGWKFAVIST